MKQLNASFLDLVTQTATNLPADVRRVMARAAAAERQGTQAKQALAIINQNIDMATDNVLPICQDTGMPTFQIRCPVGVNQIEIKDAIHEAIAEATRTGK